MERKKSRSAATVSDSSNLRLDAAWKGIKVAHCIGKSQGIDLE